MDIVKHVYCCPECGETLTKQVKPNPDNCPVAPFHRWINIGNEGTERYKCLNCKVVVHTVKRPNSYGCKMSTFHEWERV